MDILKAELENRSNAVKGHRKRKSWKRDTSSDDDTSDEEDDPVEENLDEKGEKTVCTTQSIGQERLDSPVSSNSKSIEPEHEKRVVAPSSSKPSSKRARGPGGPSKDFLLYRAFKNPGEVIYKEELVEHTLKKLLWDWEQEAILEVKLKPVIQLQRAHLAPFFEMLSGRTLGNEILNEIYGIAVALLKKDYKLMNKLYFDLSIGKMPWPIGIGECNTYEQLKHRGVKHTVGHILNDESVERYMKAIKRLLSYAENSIVSK